MLLTDKSHPDQLPGASFCVDEPSHVLTNSMGRDHRYCRFLSKCSCFPPGPGPAPVTNGPRGLKTTSEIFISFSDLIQMLHLEWIDAMINSKPRFAGLSVPLSASIPRAQHNIPTIVLQLPRFGGNNWKFKPWIRGWVFPKTPTLQTYYESITSNLHGLLLQFNPNSGEQSPAS